MRLACSCVSRCCLVPSRPSLVSIGVLSASIWVGPRTHATKDLYESISAGDYPEWTLFVQTMDSADEDK